MKGDASANEPQRPNNHHVINPHQDHHRPIPDVVECSAVVKLLSSSKSSSTCGATSSSPSVGSVGLKTLLRTALSWSDRGFEPLSPAFNPFILLSLSSAMKSERMNSLVGLIAFRCKAKAFTRS